MENTIFLVQKIQTAEWTGIDWTETKVLIGYCTDEEKAQAILKPLYLNRINERYKEIAKIKTDREDARYYAKYPIQPPKKLANDNPALSKTLEDRLKFSELMMAKAKMPAKLNREEVTQAVELHKKRQELVFSNPLKSAEASEKNRNVTDGRVIDGRAKKFKPLV